MIDNFSDKLFTEYCQQLQNQFSQIQLERPGDRDELQLRVMELLEPELDSSESEDGNSSESEDKKEIMPLNKRQRK